MLVFKGEDPKKKKKKSKHSRRDRDDTAASASTSAAAVAPPSSDNVARRPQSTASSSSSSALPMPKVEKGTGEITTSGTVVTGHGTKFEREIAAGDALIAILPGSQQQEMRVVTMRLSNVSLNLSSGFSESIKTPISFSVIRKPRDEAKQRRLAAEKATLTKKEEEEKSAGTFGSTEELVYRERTEHGSYRIRREKVEGVSRGDLLNMRSKKTSDKYC